MTNKLAQSGHHVQEVAPATIAAGTFAFMASGVAKYYDSNAQDSQPTPAGEEIAAVVGGANIWIDKANASDVYVQGAEVRGSATNQNALTTGGDGRLGYAAEASPAGEALVLVRWNG